MKKFILVTSLVSILALVGCATPNSSNVYPAYRTQSEQTVRTGVVESVRYVTIDAGTSGVGAVGGAVVGGVAGSAIGGGRGSILGAVGGAIAGGLIGNKIEENVNTKPGLEITVRLHNGRLVAVTQDADESFQVGDRVRLISDGGVTRVTH